MSLRDTWRPSDRFLVRHMDPSVLVVEKRAGLLTHSTPKGGEPNLLDLLREFVQGRGGPKNPVLPVHRLDRVVSGLLVFARTPSAQARLTEQFAEHIVERRYIAGVQGILRRDEGTIESWLRVDHASLRVFSVPEGGEGRKWAVTHWRVLERFEAAGGTLLEVELETGVRNQIRVHLAEAGHPLLGERKYAQGEDADAQGKRRIFLHAAELGFEHPFTRRVMRFEAKLPPDLDRWRRHMEEGRPAQQGGPPPPGAGPRGRRGGPRGGPRREGPRSDAARARGRGRPRR